MAGELRGAMALLVGIALLALGNGLQGTLLGVRAAMEQFGPVVTGIVMSGYMIGLLVGSLVTPRLVGQVGHIRVFAAFASIGSTAILVMSIFVDPALWFAMRLVTGICFSGLYVVAESWLNAAADNRHRGKLLSVYMVVTFAFMGLGQVLLNVADPSGYELFILVSVLVSVSLVPISLTRANAPAIENSRAVGLGELYRWSPLAVVACFANGLGQSAFFAMGAVYATLQGFTPAQVSMLMALPLIGVVVSQYPIGAASDRFDRRMVLVVLTFASAALAFACALSTELPFAVLTALFTAFGALALPLHSMAIAHANDQLDSDQMLGASGKLVMLFGVGASAGPLVVGGVMYEVGPYGFFLYMVAIYGLLGVFALYRMGVRQSKPLDEQTGFVLITPRTTAVAAAALAECAEEQGSGAGPAAAEAQPAGQ